MKHLSLFCLLFLFCTTSAFAQGGGAFLGQMNNTRTSFDVQVEVNHHNRKYTKNDLLQTTVESSEEGFLYLFYRDAAGNVVMLFPNRFKRNNAIRQNESVTVPAPESIFQIRIDAPFGKELIKAVVARKPLAYFGDLDLTGINTLAINEEEGRALAVSLETLDSSDWTEEQVVICTVDPDKQNPSFKKVIKRPILGRIIFWLKNARR